MMSIWKGMLSVLISILIECAEFADQHMEVRVCLACKSVSGSDILRPMVAVSLNLPITSFTYMDVIQFFHIFPKRGTN